MQRTNLPFLHIFIVVLSFLGISLQAQENIKSFIFDENLLEFEKVAGYDLIRYADFEISQQVGAPQLPVKIVHFALPPGKDIAKISIKSVKKKELEGKYNLYPAQPPQILSDSKYRFAPQDQKVYSSSEFFPAEIVKMAPAGYFSGSNVGALLIYPVQYLPADSKLLFISELEIELIFKDSKRLPRYFKGTKYASGVRQQSLRNIIKNPQSIPQSLQKSNLTDSVLPDEEHFYIIITSNNLVSSFQPLADWKLKKGLSAKIVTTSEIYSNYNGNDNQEKIRNFIIDAYQKWGTMWVLLGGDTEIIPHRSAYAFDCEYSSYVVNYIPCDLYYSDLDGDWNANGNDIYGEIDDDIDMYADVFVGRAPVENAAEADAFVNKIISYEKNGLNGAELEVLFLAEVLWSNPYTNSGVGKDYIDKMYVPERFDPITKLYEHNNNESYESAIQAINQGQNIINHDGHAGTSGMSIGEGMLTNDDMDNLRNEPQYPILFSIGCWPAAFDGDCIAEHFLTNPHGGGVAFIGNSRYGWGSPGNPEYGYSDRFDQQFFKSLFADDIFHIGCTVSAAKAYYVPYSAQENVYRWCGYQINLMGDPEMPIWTDTPRNFTVNHPDKLPLGKTSCRVTVTDGSRPVEGALVSLMQGSDVYQTGLTELDGSVSFDFSTSNPANNLQITVTAHNFLPYENTIALDTDKSYIQISAYATNGSNRGFIIPDTLVTMDCCFKNYGNQPATGIAAILSCSDMNITMIDSLESIGTIQPSDSAIVQNAFSFQIGPDLINGEVIQLNLKITDSSENSWADLVSITGTTPIIVYNFHQMSDSLNGDADNFAEPGEMVSISLSIQNRGLVSAQNVSVALNSSSSYLSLPQAALNFGNIHPDGIMEAVFEMSIDADCPDVYFPQINLAIETDRGSQFEDSFLVSIGEFGIQDNIEKGSANWTHIGSPDLWQLTSERKHSGSVSWYCGNKSTLVHDNNMENSLISHSFTLDYDSELSFWCWYECPNYGVTGLYPEINNGSGWKKLDFIGSGGALGILSTGNNWLRYSYDLSGYSAGSTAQIRFRFVSDYQDPKEGVYIDDIIVQRKNRSFSFEFPTPPLPDLMFEDVDDNIKVSWEGNFEDIENFNRDGYSFQGYNVYQLSSMKNNQSNLKRIATFDIIDGVTEIAEDIIDPETEEVTRVVQQHGSDSGIQRNFVFEKDYLNNYHFIKGKFYYFAVSAYTYNPDVQASQKCTETMLDVRKIIFQKDQPGYAYEDTIRVNHTKGKSDAIVSPVVMDPPVLTGHNYRIDFNMISDDNLVWNLTDLTIDQVLLSQQKVGVGEDVDDPCIDGFKMIVRNPLLLDFSEIVIEGNGNYFITSRYRWNVTGSARAIDIFGKGTTDIQELGKDYELRMTGELEESSADNVIYIKEGTGSMATIYAAQYYELKDHPMNPNPNSNDPFAVRIPFEVWNIDDNRQVNLLIYDDTQHPSFDEFYAFSIYYMTGFIMNTPYHESAIDTSSAEMNDLTWHLIFLDTYFETGDVVRILYNDLLTEEDVYTFHTDTTRFPDDSDQNLPQTFELFQNYPNPFNTVTVISFQLPQYERVELKIYDILGCEIRTLIDGEMQPGIKKCVWDGTNNRRQSVSSGIYFYILDTQRYHSVHKMLLIR